MKKHFLLLVMALMSMTSWAQGLTFGEVGIAPYTYGGALATDAVVQDSKGSRLVKGTDYEISTVAYSDETFATTVATKDMKAGQNYYLKITGKGAYDGQVKGVYFTVLQAELTINLNAGVLDRGFGEDPVALTDAMFGAPSGFKFEDNASVLKGSHPTTYATADNNVGAAKTIVFGAGKFADNYNVKYTGTLAITAKSLTSSNAEITSFQKDVVYTGKNIIPQYTVKTKGEGGVVLTQGTAPVLFANVAEYNAAKDPDIDESTFAGLDEAAKIKTPGTGDFYVLTVVRDVNKYTPTIKFQGNYTGTLSVPDEKDKAFNVTPAPATVVINNLEVEYNATDQADQTSNTKLEYSFSGYVGEDVGGTTMTTLIAAFKSAITDASAETSVKVAGQAINASTYDLDLSTKATVVGNYEFTTFIGSTLTIKPKKVQLTAKDASKSVGQADPKFELTDAYKADLLAGDALALPDDGFTREEGEDAGKTYAITPVTTAAKIEHSATVDGKVVKTDVTANYEVVAATPKGKLSIKSGSIVVSIMNADKFYGQEDPEFTYNVRGLQGDDKLAAFTITRDMTATDPEAAGAYIMTAEVANPNPDKYATVTVVPGIFTIKQAELDITMPVQNITNAVGGESTPDVTKLTKEGITADGINNADDIKALITLGYNGAPFVGDKSYDNGYTATLTTAAAKNYKFVKVNGKELSTPGSVAYGKLIVGEGSATLVTLNRAAKADFEDNAITGKNNTAAVIEANNGETVNVKFGDFKMLPEKWYPIVLPFETTVSAISSAFGYAVVNVLNTANTDASKVSFKLHMGTLPANTPFVVKVYNNKTADKSINMKDALALRGQIVAPADYARVTTTEAKDQSGITFIGTYTGKTDGFRANQWYFSASADYNQYYPGNDTNTTYLRPLGAYLEATTAGARILEFEEADGTITAISSMKAENEAASAEGWYTIGGVKLEGAPSQKGIYIQNGKKVIVK